MSNTNQRSSAQTPLPQAIRQHTREFELSDSQMDRLLKLDTPKRPRKIPTFNIFGRYGVMPFAVACLLFITFGAFIAPGYYKARQVLQEVAYNHNKQMSLEVVSGSLETINGYLSQLDFSLVKSDILNPREWELLGGRYCSIDGQLAAQLKVKNKDTQKVYTYYQALVPENIFEQDIEGFADGVKVKLWQERGLIMGLAGGSLP